MSSFVIEGGQSLKGRIKPQGAKNEALQVISSILLTAEEVIIENIPNIIDVNRLIEILKFIGDAALIIFPDRHLSHNHEDSINNRNALDIKSILLQLVFTIQEIREIEIDGEKLIDLGVGLHMGDVYYGNIGAKDRLDFTVMGPAVNLASRLESLTKDLSASILFSVSVYEQLTEKDRSELSIVSYAPQQVKGVSDKVLVWGVKV